MLQRYKKLIMSSEAFYSFRIKYDYEIFKNKFFFQLEADLSSKH